MSPAITFSETMILEDVIHAAGVVHHDISPSGFLIFSEGGNEGIVSVDFWNLSFGEGQE
jgi:serine/threonine protein kinase